MSINSKPSYKTTTHPVSCLSTLPPPNTSSGCIPTTTSLSILTHLSCDSRVPEATWSWVWSGQCQWWGRVRRQGRIPIGMQYSKCIMSPEANIPWWYNSLYQTCCDFFTAGTIISRQTKKSISKLINQSPLSPQAPNTTTKRKKTKKLTTPNL